MEGLRVTGPGTGALAARVAARNRRDAALAGMRDRVAGLIGLCDVLVPRGGRCHYCARPDGLPSGGCACERTEHGAVEHRGRSLPMERERRCGVCGSTFSTDPPCCRFSFDALRGAFK